MRRPKATLLLVSAAVLGAAALAVSTRLALVPLPSELHAAREPGDKAEVFDRNGAALSRTRKMRWNRSMQARLHEIPPLMQDAFLAAEDKRFYRHNGVDWRARLGALWQSARALRVVRGASTISEQVVRLLHPRPRTLWSRWLEGIEARRLERRFSKPAVLEFYLNQVPFARQLRGVRQAASYYFDRDLGTLNEAEMLALAVLVRAPARFDPLRKPDALRTRILRLAAVLADEGKLGRQELERIARTASLELRAPTLAAEAPHLVRAVLGQGGGEGELHTTVSAGLQARLALLLEERLRQLGDNNVRNAALLAVDHSSDEVLAWVNAAGPGGASDIDGVVAARQAGSTLKPFLYALALERGYTPATLLQDAPLQEAVNSGLHVYRNYSRTYYGPLRLRLALGNSLNTPAVRVAQQIGPAAFLRRLHELGFDSLQEPADHYGEGLALGNGEVTLRELVGAYAALARGGVYRELRVQGEPHTAGRRVLDREACALIADILADPEARRLEFARDTLALFPAQTALKTGTSSDYHDAWAVAFSRRHTVGVWMGNLSREPMREVSGSIGPAAVLPGVFAELERGGRGQALALSPELVKRRVCAVSGKLAGPGCPALDELFDPEHAPLKGCSGRHRGAPRERKHDEPVLLQPSNGLRVALDPRLPDSHEAMVFEVSPTPGLREVRWLVDGQEAAATRGRRYTWPLRRGEHHVEAAVAVSGSEAAFITPGVTFWVK